MLKNVVKTAVKLSGNHLSANLMKKRYAGHSKWQNIRHIKGAKDAERSRLFTKLIRQIKVAVQEGGGSNDPTKNLKLEQIVEQAKRANMPVATIQSTLKSCLPDNSQTKGHVLEIKGPGSCFILCEVFTNHLPQLKVTMGTILRKHQSSFCGNTHLFEEKGVIEVLVPEGKTAEQVLETATEHAIESGAEDVELVDNNILQFVCSKYSFNQVVKALEQLKYEVTSASLEYIPLKMQSLEEKDLELCRKLYDKLESLPEVVRLSDNIG